jgi:SHS2 domain-containing protein
MHSTLGAGPAGRSAEGSMPKASYHLLEHPSDLGIEASGLTVGEAFEQAALGLISVIAETESIESLNERRVTVDAQDYENLLVKWLSEILYLYDGEDFLLKEAKAESISPTRLVARVSGEKYKPEKHKLKMDVKAVTYHQLSIETSSAMTTVRVFLDI